MQGNELRMRINSKIPSSFCVSVLQLFICLISINILIFTSSPVFAIEDCTVSSTGVSFGTYVYTTPSPTNSTGSIQVSCSLLGIVSLLVGYNILLSSGNSGSHSTRQLQNGTNSLQYNLYTNAGRTIIWGDGNSGSSKISDGYLLGLGTIVRNYNIYGSILSSQNVPKGNYTDFITVTVNY